MILIAPPLRRMPSVYRASGCEPDAPCIQKDPLKKTHTFVNLRRAKDLQKYVNHGIVWNTN